jgi:hypothetical protein
MRNREERVRHIMGLIAGGRWVEGGPSLLAQAREWGIAPRSVEGIVAEAQRRVAALDEGDFIRRMVTVAIAELLEDAKAMVKAGDPRALTGFAQNARLICDVNAAQKSATPSTDGVPVFRVELTAAPSPPTDPCPAPSGPSSPPDGDQGAG